MIQNPILPGFNPDPCIVRVGEDYYVAVSSFEWFPGIPLYHSKDLKHWELIDYAIKTRDYADLTGERPSKGVWAPCLSYCEEEKRFYLLYSNIHGSNPWAMDVDNYLIWADSLHGPWSEPVFVNASGFDASLFHDGAKKWVILQERDFRPHNLQRRPLVLQEFSMNEKKLTGKPIKLNYGFTGRGFAEGPHIYKHDGYYYLLLAEGGTGFGHCAAIGRSKNAEGPYEPCPYNPIITSAPQRFSVEDKPDSLKPEFYNTSVTIQKAGHASIVQTQTGEWYAVHLCSRPVMPQMRCVLGRETAIQKMEWTQDGWIRMADGTNVAKDETLSPNLIESPVPEQISCDHFDGEKLNIIYNSPRNPIEDDWADMKGKKSFLRLRGRESLVSAYYPSLIARRLTSFKAQVTTKMNFEPETYRQTAGLTCYYNNENYFCIYKSFDEKLGEVLGINGFHDAKFSDYDFQLFPIAKGTIGLRAEIDGDKLQFSYSLVDGEFQKLGPVLDMTRLSDEANGYHLFTGAYVGVFATDLYLRTQWAEFDYLNYINKD